MKKKNCRKYFFTILIFFAVLLLASAGVRAAPIVDLFSTGVDNTGQVLSPGSSEQHYGVSGASNDAFVVSQWPTWLTPPAGSAWIGPANGNISGPDGKYTYELTFDLTGLDYNNFVMSGGWATDNISQIWLNGKDTLFATPLGSAFKMLHSFALHDGFNQHFNKLEFIVINASLGASGDNPTGLLVANLQASVVPIPGAVWLFGSGLICLLGLRRTFRSGEKSP